MPSLEGGRLEASAEERLRDFADAAFEWFWEQDADLRFTYFSSNVEVASGFPAGEFLGRTRGELCPFGVSPEAWSRHLDDLLNRRPFRDFRYGREDRHGRMRWFLTGGKPIYDAKGGFAGYRGVGREITAEVEAEARARAAEERLTDAIENLSDGFVLFDKDDRLVRFNNSLPGFAAIFGDGAIGRTYRDLLIDILDRGLILRPPEFATDEGWVDYVLALRAPGYADYEVQTRRGRWFACRDRRTRDGGTVGIRVDITEAKRREEELARREARALAAEQRLRDAVDAMSDGFILYDADDRVVACNQALIGQVPTYGSTEAVVGQGYEELMRKTAASGYFADPAARADPVAWVEALRQNRARNAELKESIEIAAADGRIYLHRAHRTREGGIVGIRTDVTETRRRQAELASREARALAAEQRLRDAIEAMADTFVLYDADDRVVVCNQRYVDQIGAASVEEVQGHTYTENMRGLLARGFFDEPSASSDPEKWIADRIAERGRRDGDRDVTLADGRVQHVRTQRTRDGGLVSIMSDVTEHRAREARAIAAELRLREAIESMTDGFSLRGPDDRMILINSRHLEIFGLADDAAIAGQTWMQVASDLYARGFYHSSITLEQVAEWDRRQRADVTTGVHDRDVPTRDGRILHVRVRRTPDGMTLQVTSDITAERDREARALRAEQQLRDAIESLSDGFILRDADDLPVMCNRRYLDIFGFAAEELAGMSSDDVRRALFGRGFFADSQISRDPEAWFAGWLRSHRGSDAQDIRLADGRVLSVRTRPTRTGGMVTIFADVTAERERGKREREAELLLRTAIDSIDDSFSLWDANDRLLMWNRAYETRMKAAGTGPIRGITYHDFVLLRAQEGSVDSGGRLPSDYAKQAVSRHRRLEAREVSYRDGTTVMVRERTLPDGGIVRLDTDITDRKRQERLLREAEAQLRTAIETLDDGFSLWDADDRLVLWNRHLEELFGITGVAVERGMPFQKWVERHVRSGKVDTGGLTTGEFVAQRGEAHRAYGAREITFTDGRTLLVREQRLPEGGTVRLDIEITSRKRQETLLLEAKEAAEQASRAKSTFLASMSHELRTPLNAILGFSETMAKEMLGPLGTRRYVDYAGDIHASGMLLLDLINDMLDMSRIEAGRYELRRETVKPDELAQEALGVIGVQAEKAEVTVEARIQPSMKRFALDRRAVRQVLLNLLSNAIKFSRAGDTVTLHAEVVDGTLRYRIVDRGIGIAKQDIGRLARPFERAGNVMTQPIQGTGLGLSISKRLIELHGGRLEIESELDRGTIVTVLLPPIGA